MPQGGLPYTLADLMARDMGAVLSPAAMLGNPNFPAGVVPGAGVIPGPIPMAGLPVAGSTQIYNDPALQRFENRSARAMGPVLRRLARGSKPTAFRGPIAAGAAPGTSLVPFAGGAPATIPGTSVVPYQGGVPAVAPRTLGALVPDEIIMPDGTRVLPTGTTGLPSGATAAGGGAGGAGGGGGGIPMPPPRPTGGPNIPPAPGPGYGSRATSFTPPFAPGASLNAPVPAGAGAGAGAAGGGRLANLMSNIKPASFARGAAGLGVGLVATPMIQSLADMAIGGETEDPGFSWGGLGKAALAGAGGGGLAGAVASGGSGALPGAVIGGLLGAGGYLMEEKAAADKEVDVGAAMAKMQNFVNQYGIDPTLAQQVIGNYDLMAQVYMDDKELRGQLKDLTQQSMMQLAGLVGQRSSMMTPEQAKWMSSFALEQMQPFYSQIGADSPYKVAALQQLAAIPANISLQSIMSPQGMASMGASNAPAALSAGLTPEQIRELENA